MKRVINRSLSGFFSQFNQGTTASDTEKDHKFFDLMSANWTWFQTSLCEENKRTDKVIILKNKKTGKLDPDNFGLTTNHYR